MKTPKKRARKPAATKADQPALGPTPACPFYIAGLGASAGGLEALRGFFEAVPAECGVAFVVIQHLAPDFKSHMTELLAEHAAMPVQQAKDGMPVAPNQVYLIPPGKCLKLFHGRLLLSDPTREHGQNLPIDLFFRSLAADQGERAIAIALSGTGSDGARGIRAIKEAGGMVMVKCQESARFSGMPKSAIETGLADFILPPKDLPDAMLKFIQHPLIARPDGKRLQAEDTTLDKIAALVRAQSGVDFGGYKQTTVMRRLERRMGIAQLETLGEYLDFLGHSEQEVEALGRDLLISVTRFFRDPEVFAALREKVLPALCEHAAPDRTIRVWVPGCATGEEAYSIAMLLDAQLAASGERCEVKIFATDVDQRAIEFAGAGLYPKSIAADVPGELFSRYFVADGEGWRIGRRIREQIVFARQNILRDPPFTKMDLISCRNLLIYLKSDMQKKVLSLLQFALRPGGWLMLGTSETVGDRADAFETLSGKDRIYRKRGEAHGALAEAIHTMPNAQPKRTGFALESERSAQLQHGKLWETISTRLIEQFVPTGLVINQKNEILHSFGEPQHFIGLQPGRATLDVLRLAPRELSLSLATAIRRAAKEGKPVAYRRVRFTGGGVKALVNLRVEPLRADSGETGLFLVFFEEPKEKKHVAAASHEYDASSKSIQRIADLEEDLRTTQANLQSVTEDKETIHEELQASNQELLASNEELQSSNEELESVNEELSTLNTEFQQKISELTLANNDLENFLRTSDVATIFLDQTLRIRRFTPAVTREMSLKPHDAGRLLTDFSHPIVKALTGDLAEVAASGTPSLKTAETSPGVWHLLRVTPYRREGASDRGFVVTILEVTKLVQTEPELSSGRERLKPRDPPATK